MSKARNQTFWVSVIFAVIELSDIAFAVDSIPAVFCVINVEEVLPPVLDSTSESPPLFDGTTRLYLNYECPFCQRVWIVRNYKGLHDKIKLIAIHLRNKPGWYKEKLYPENKVPSLEHNGKVIGESLDLIKYLDSNFEGPALLPDDSWAAFTSLLMMMASSSWYKLHKTLLQLTITVPLHPIQSVEPS
ncbi:glutathione S-transferase L3-like [Olea europaea subsp. europaea]|uniref:Glutathione S-transferase L3-like n=1 Tax=Olea europaea subsp. europaea TaxID=158383 RepID=A0A8S0Q8W7_OLEEU|nr:glutathione S-transferase L3-like [Olea europaea subsp. europaea]